MLIQTLFSFSSFDMKRLADTTRSGVTAEHTRRHIRHRRGAHNAREALYMYLPTYSGASIVFAAFYDWAAIQLKTVHDDTGAPCARELFTIDEADVQVCVKALVGSALLLLAGQAGQRKSRDANPLKPQHLQRCTAQLSLS